MSYVMGGMAIGGGILGMMGRDKNKTITTNSNTSNQGQSTWAPHPQLLPAYGGMLDHLNRMGQTPTPFFPGATYVGPSGPTMQGVNMGMSSMPYYEQGAQGMRAAGGQYGQAGAMAPGVANQFGQAGGAYGNAGQAFNMAVPGQLGALGTALGNYDFLSRSADVANNPYVQGQADAMKRTVNQNFSENLLPAINQGANQVNALGSSRHALAQAQGAERTAEQLSRGLADLYGGAYGQGLSAQQSALGQLGNMQAGFARPGETMARGAQMMQNRANMGLQGMGALGQGAGYTERGAQAFGAGGDMLNRGATNALAYGNVVQGHQREALNDAIRRHQYQFQEPRERFLALGNMMGMFQPMGTGHTTGVGNGQGVQPNANYQSGPQAFLGGAFAGAGMGSKF